ncbi:secondary thiamine-phosphate synthase enzyme YjbQ [Dongshaea marina]|uniref:secondary thiamine-phosphate synthase enzyme YjbQ n=1 Tax=Dongshaea marina TaxID=2047966 RepID=UPI000D3EDEEA|nr:secondary thiamine-phosphate synthase enzyme YjbQ [Dongshaea marina]
MWQQKKLQLKPRARGFHLITQEILSQLPELGGYKLGLCQLFLQHTSASLTINENADPTVRSDMESYFNRSVPQCEPYYQHTYEGDDDMPAHIKATQIGCSLLIPVSSGELVLGRWQGIYLGEHRDHGGARQLIATLQGEYF